MDFVDNRIDPSTGTMRARGVFPNADHSLSPGFFARIRIPGSGKYQALLIPERAVGADQAQKFVYVVNAEKKVEYGKIGRVMLTTLTKETFIPRFLERDQAIRRPPCEPGEIIGRGWRALLRDGRAFPSLRRGNHHAPAGLAAHPAGFRRDIAAMRILGTGD